jgi:hypothetical protein
MRSQKPYWVVLARRGVTKMSQYFPNGSCSFSHIRWPGPPKSTSANSKAAQLSGALFGPAAGVVVQRQPDSGRRAQIFTSRGCKSILL